MLTSNQWGWIAARTCAGSDREACDTLGISQDMVGDWKHQPEFLKELDQAGRDTVRLAREMARSYIGEAMRLAIDMARNATKVTSTGRETPDNANRMRAIELLSNVNSLIVSRSEVSGPDGGPIASTWGPDLSGLSDEELAQLRGLLAKAQSTGKGKT